MMLNADANAFRLILKLVLDDPAWKDDLPRLLQGAMERPSAWPLADHHRQRLGTG